MRSNRTFVHEGANASMSRLRGDLCTSRRARSTTAATIGWKARSRISTDPATRRSCSSNVCSAGPLRRTYLSVEVPERGRDRVATLARPERQRCAQRLGRIVPRDLGHQEIDVELGDATYGRDALA